MVDWASRGGAEQTSFFARLAIEMLPRWFWEAASSGLSFIDIGCALGDGLPNFRTRLPKSKLTGLDVSKVAIRMAKERLPNFSFRAVKEDWSDAPRGDIIFCSNTLEHMKDWRKRLVRLSELADHYVLALVPFQEWTRIDEHVVTFDFTSFPPALPDGRRLLFLHIIDAAQAKDTHWPGHQALVIYGAKVSSADGPAVAASFDPYVGIDFRGRQVAQVKAALLALQAAYPDVQISNVQSRVESPEGAIDRVNAEWAKKLEVSVAEMNAKHVELREHYERLLHERDAKLERTSAELVAKHGELKTHYERVLGERDARISQLSELQAWRQRAQELENALRENLLQQLKRAEQEAQALAEQAAQARVEAAHVHARERELALVHERVVAGELRESRLHEEIERLRQEILAAQPLRLQLEVLQKEVAAQVAALMDWSSRYDALRADYTAMAEQLESEKLSSQQARTAAECAERAAEVALLQLREAQALTQSARAEAEAARCRAEAEAAGAGGVKGQEPSVSAEEVQQLKADLKRATADNSALKAAIRHAVDERDRARNGQGGAPIERLRALEGELASARAEIEAGQAIGAAMGAFAVQLDASLAALQAAWQSDYARLSGRSALLEQRAEGLRAQVTRILRSKSMTIGTWFRRVYWTVLGQPGAASEAMPEALPPAPEGGSDFLHIWNTAKQATDVARRELEQRPPTPVSTMSSQQAVTLHPVVTDASPSQSISQPGGRVIAVQAASLGSGGLERVVFDTASGLHARGETVIAIVISGGGMFAEKLRQRGIAVHEVNRDVVAYEKVLRENGVTDLFAHHSYFGYERAASLGIRLYDVVHNYYFWHRNNAAMIRRVCDLCTRIVYVSSAVRTFHEHLFSVPHDKGVVINNPVHLDGLIVPDKKQLERLREKSVETIFLNVAQAFPSKAQPAMITAFARAYRKNRNMRLQIAGAPVKEEAERAVKERIEAEDVANAVELLGHCDRRRMSRLYAEAHAFVLPSLYEGYSVSAIEAATYKLPLILTGVGGAEDLIARSGCGILLPPATEDLAKLDPTAIEKLGLEPENAATAALARAFEAIAADRPQWINRGLEARYDIRSLDDVIEAYLAAMPAIVRAAV